MESNNSPEIPDRRETSDIPGLPSGVLLGVGSEKFAHLFTGTRLTTEICSRIPDSIGKDIEKACQGIYPLHDVYVRKVKVLKKPKFDGKYSVCVHMGRAGCNILYYVCIFLTAVAFFGTAVSVSKQF